MIRSFNRNKPNNHLLVLILIFFLYTSEAETIAAQNAVSNYVAQIMHSS